MIAYPELFQGLAPEDAASLLALGTDLQLPSGAVVFSLGDDADRLFLVERGRISLTLPIQIGGRLEEVLVEERGPGQVLGWSALIPPHHFTLRATAPLASALRAFSRVALIEHFETRPDVGRVVYRNVGTVIGHRLHVLQAMWLREMQRNIEHHYA
jgi:CRP-like cAMP-binding protein